MIDWDLQGPRAAVCARFNPMTRYLSNVGP